MIPLKLIIKNFLSYGPTTQTINFEPFHLICLSGKNGHGKSALLDAITWAIWGQARKISGQAKSDPHLIHLGQIQMFVILDFSFNGQTYRVRRECIKEKNKVTTTLDFGLLNQTGIFSSLTTTALSTTQEEIEKIIGLNYETFVNTAFLRQGNANEFSKRTAKERKEILCSILGLSLYEEQRTRALEKLRSYQEKQAVCQMNRARIAQEKQELAVIIAQQETINKQIEILTTKEKSHADQVAAVSQQLHTTRLEIEHIKEKHAKNQIAQKTYTQFYKELVSAIKTWRSEKKQLRTNVDLDELESTQKKSAHALNEQQEKAHAHATILQELAILKDAQIALVRTIERAQQEESHALTQAHTTLKQRIEECVQQQKQHEQQEKLLLQKQATLTAEQAEIQKKIEALTAAIKREDQHLFEKRKQKYHEWNARAQQTKHAYDQLTGKIELAHTEMNQSCPLCEQHLSASRRSFLEEKYMSQKKDLVHQLNRFSRVLPALKSLLIDQHADLQKNKIDEQMLIEQHTLYQKNNELIAELTQAQTQTAALLTRTKKEHADCIRNNEKIEGAITNLSTRHQKERCTNPEVINIQNKITDLETKLARTAYDQLQHHTLLKEHELASAAYQNGLLFSHKKLRVDQERATIFAKIDQARQLKAHITNDSELITQLNHTHSLLQKLLTHEAELKETELITKQHLGNLLQEKGKINHAHARYADLTTQITREEETHTHNTQQIEEYTAIAQALGKDGIQALLIEEAIPEIEHETNKLLSQLTDNQAHIIIEPLRDLKKGGTKETLDIKISDTAGIRPYELFSGGEAFRIDFALRIAISKLLARRAGTALQTLIIDEGFGSQDEEGLSHIMDAIHKIQEHFSKVIIVSHLDTMKEQFPVHFLVSKSAQGTKLSVFEQG